MKRYGIGIYTHKMQEAETGNYYRTDEVDANMVSYAFHAEALENKDAEIADKTDALNIALSSARRRKAEITKLKADVAELVDMLRMLFDNYEDDLKVRHHEDIETLINQYKEK